MPEENNQVGAEEGGGERVAEGGCHVWLQPVKGGERVLFLTVKRAYFDVMVTGEKSVEFRKKTRYWDLRLTHEDGSFREFDYVLFQRGFCEPLRRFRVPWVGTTIVTEHTQEWSNGAKVAFTGEEFYAISLGPVCSTSSSAGNACVATPKQKTRMCPYRKECMTCAAQKRPKTWPGSRDHS